MRERVLRGLAVWGAAVVAVGGVVPVASADDRPEADLAYHGSATMRAGLVDVRFTPLNHGPSAVSDATVRLRWSEALAYRPELPQGCARSGPRVVVCRVGALPADGLGERVELAVRLRGASSEVVLEIDTVWSGGAVDRNRANDRQRVLVLDTGDDYYF
ncbi:hypothetical protein [Streptomyces resistomycificus]|uniref:Uncharacterized protein n=1 Tax=Streptomyces resistomycificus TaxID=67356 RepID=A0A0L8KRF5_9ACTN|nr:hypothetical protein [Streptomyces resistomycificus]KOG28546.1 hypothetical protein ADK37_39695 [Streptomyces resistomycificus]KUN91169.1 hypothetical protein AQJ84_36875 [Streptomyces resistomycificus]